MLHIKPPAVLFQNKLRKLLHDLIHRSVPPKLGQSQHLIAEGLEGELHSRVSLVHENPGDPKAQRRLFLLQRLDKPIAETAVPVGNKGDVSVSVVVLFYQPDGLVQRGLVVCPASQKSAALGVLHDLLCSHLPGRVVVGVEIPTAGKADQSESRLVQLRYQQKGVSHSFPPGGIFPLGGAGLVQTDDLGASPLADLLPAGVLLQLFLLILADKQRQGLRCSKEGKFGRNKPAKIISQLQTVLDRKSVV